MARGALRQRGSRWLLRGLPVLLVGCLEQPADLKASIELVTTSSGEVQEQALRTLLAHGRAALPALEAVLHRPDPRARHAGVVALRRLGLAETAPLLGHVAQFDPDLGIRREARTQLEKWAAEKSARGESAQKALFLAAPGDVNQ